MTKPKVTLRVPTFRHERGETIEVADAATADAMVEMRQADRVKGDKSETKSD